MNRLQAIVGWCDIHHHTILNVNTLICLHCTSHDPKIQSGFTPGMEGFTNNRRAVEDQIARKQEQDEWPLG